MKRLIIFVLLAVCFISCKKFECEVDVVTVHPHLVEQMQADIFTCEKAGMTSSIYKRSDGDYTVFCKGKIKGKERGKSLDCIEALRVYEGWRKDIAEK